MAAEIVVVLRDRFSTTLDAPPPEVALVFGKDGYYIMYVPKESVAEAAKARVDRERDQLNDNMTSCQTRCSELLNEVRAMRMAAATLVDPVEWKRTFEKALASLTGKKT